MKILAFETSAKAASAAIVSECALLAECYQNTGLTHSRTLLSMAQNLLETCALALPDIDAIAVAAGPGSFTGVRIGVAAAKGLAWGRKLPLYGVSTLEAMACGLGASRGIVCPVMDARREQVYNAIFQADGSKLTRLRPDRAISLAELAEDLSRLSAPVYLIGDGATLCRDWPNVTLVPEHRQHQRACGVGLAALAAIDAGDPGDAASLQPQYLRLSQAERERLERLHQHT